METFDLLRKAADAMGYTYTHEWNREREESGSDAGLFVCDVDRKLVHTAWNPLRDDACALRLAVALKIRIGFRPAAYADTPTGLRFFGAHDGDDANARTRLAIVRAAAELSMRPNAALESDPGEATSPGV
jgi:hypothetical protein